MKRLQSILCASLLTLSISSAALAGNIYGGAPTDGNIYGAPKDGNIYGAPGNIYGAPGNIYGFTDEAYSDLLSLLGAIRP